MAAIFSCHCQPFVHGFCSILFANSAMVTPLMVSSVKFLGLVAHFLCITTCCMILVKCKADGPLHPPSTPSLCPNALSPSLGFWLLRRRRRSSRLPLSLELLALCTPQLATASSKHKEPTYHPQSFSSSVPPSPSVSPALNTPIDLPHHHPTSPSPHQSVYRHS